MRLFKVIAHQYMLKGLLDPSRPFSFKRIVMKYLVILFFLMASPAWSQSIDRRAVEVSNQVVMNIYNDISSQKDRYPELANLSQENLSKNEYGIYRLNYVYPMTDQFGNTKNYGFDVTVSAFNGSDDLTSKGEGFFNYDFPLLKVRMLGNQTFVYKSKQFNIRDIIEQNKDVLANEQQKRLPFRLAVSTAKDSFSKDEDIEFIVTLQNTTDHVLMVKELSPKTVHFLINGQAWQITAVKEGKRISHSVLKSGESMTRRFNGQGLNRRKEFDVVCTYSMTYEGINPTASLKVKIIHPESPISFE
jgi:hypothetical protein